jgi:hypothetical protein
MKKPWPLRNAFGKQNRISLRSISGPRSGDGYQDSFGLYSASFIPNQLDPTGEETRTFKFKCAEITVTIEKGVEVKSKLTKEEGCCECEKVIGKQWWQFGSDSDFSEDNAETKTPFYNYDPVKDIFIPGYGGDGQILDSPTTNYPGISRIWISCFYCKNKGSYNFLGCVQWSLYANGNKGWSIDDLPTSLPTGAADPTPPPPPAPPYIPKNGPGGGY